jgi:hypothetical protein
VAVRTDLLIDLIAALQLRLVINPQRTQNDQCKRGGASAS